MQPEPVVQTSTLLMLNSDVLQLILTKVAEVYLDCWRDLFHRVSMKQSSKHKRSGYTLPFHYNELDLYNLNSLDRYYHKGMKQGGFNKFFESRQMLWDNMNIFLFLRYSLCIVCKQFDAFFSRHKFDTVFMIPDLHFLSNRKRWSEKRLDRLDRILPYVHHASVDFLLHKNLNPVMIVISSFHVYSLDGKFCFMANPETSLYKIPFEHIHERVDSVIYNARSMLLLSNTMTVPERITKAFLQKGNKIRTLYCRANVEGEYQFINDIKESGIKRLKVDCISMPHKTLFEIPRNVKKLFLLMNTCESDNCFDSLKHFKFTELKVICDIKSSIHFPELEVDDFMLMLPSCIQKTVVIDLSKMKWKRFVIKSSECYNFDAEGNPEFHTILRILVNGNKEPYGDRKITILFENDTIVKLERLINMFETIPSGLNVTIFTRVFMWKDVTYNPSSFSKKVMDEFEDEVMNIHGIRAKSYGMDYRPNEITTTYDEDAGILLKLDLLKL
jgi:hypothetical protein